MTYTYVELNVSESTYNEVKQLLEEAGYGHCFMEEGAINMHGMALVLAPQEVRLDDMPVPLKPSDV